MLSDEELKIKMEIPIAIDNERGELDLSIMEGTIVYLPLIDI